MLRTILATAVTFLIVGCNELPRQVQKSHISGLVDSSFYIFDRRDLTDDALKKLRIESSLLRSSFETQELNAFSIEGFMVFYSEIEEYGKPIFDIRSADSIEEVTQLTNGIAKLIQRIRNGLPYADTIAEAWTLCPFIEGEYCDYFDKFFYRARRRLSALQIAEEFHIAIREVGALAEANPTIARRNQLSTLLDWLKEARTMTMFEFAKSPAFLTRQKGFDTANPSEMDLHAFTDYLLETRHNFSNVSTDKRGEERNSLMSEFQRDRETDTTPSLPLLKRRFLRGLSVRNALLSTGDFLTNGDPEPSALQFLTANLSLSITKGLKCVLSMQMQEDLAPFPKLQEKLTALSKEPKKVARRASKVLKMARNKLSDSPLLLSRLTELTVLWINLAASEANITKWISRLEDVSTPRTDVFKLRYRAWELRNSILRGIPNPCGT